MQKLNAIVQTRMCPKCKQEDIPITSKECTHCGADVRNWFVRHKTATGFLILFAIVLMANYYSVSKLTSNRSTVTSTSKTQQVASDKQTEDAVQPSTKVKEEPKPVEVQSTPQAQTEPQSQPEQKTNPTLEKKPNPDPVAAIQKTLNASDKYELTVWTLDSDFAKADSKPPFEVIINTSAGQVQDCFAAKSILFDLMKAAYTNDETKDKIARIQFTAWGQLKGSLGSKDTGFDWNASGPSNFWKVLQEYNPSVDETSPMDQRTFGIRINKSCE